MTLFYEIVNIYSRRHNCDFDRDIYLGNRKGKMLIEESIYEISYLLYDKKGTRGRKRYALPMLSSATYFYIISLYIDCLSIHRMWTKSKMK